MGEGIGTVVAGVESTKVGVGETMVSPMLFLGRRGSSLL